MGDAGGSYGMVLEMLGLASLPLDWGPIVKNNRDKSKQKENNKNTPNSKQKDPNNNQKWYNRKSKKNVCLQIFNL